MALGGPQLVYAVGSPHKLEFNVIQRPLCAPFTVNPGSPFVSSYTQSLRTVCGFPSAMHSSLIQLECQCNNYPWGKKGKESLVARFAAVTPGGHFKLDESKYYAEFGCALVCDLKCPIPTRRSKSFKEDMHCQWMGTYPITPSLILSSRQDLQEYLKANREALIGNSILAKFGADLPFSLKILSVAEALRLQIHPDKDLAAKLYERNPEKYDDANHKPEIAVALSKFEILEAASTVLKSSFVPKDARAHFTPESLKTIVSKILMSSDEENVDVYKKLRAMKASEFGKGEEHIAELLPRLAEQYDKSGPGILIAVLASNFMVMEKGESNYVPAECF
ncbi:hypothetical protein B2J93_4810 [Marssonina coronariae]|uniref:Phosphomannose isomerase type I catalytic domain-containing protein n=1 Tax=Diplocarpon coronariae TaxID=2795749 RepID=A0A218YZH5_9HELO|nr:hypothetical protein B2J93_4810 [Marssonina coronariae]